MRKIEVDSVWEAKYGYDIKTKQEVEIIEIFGEYDSFAICETEEENGYIICRVDELTDLYRFGGDD